MGVFNKGKSRVFTGKKTTKGTYYIDYKDTDELLRFIGPNGKILSRRRTRLSSMQQRQVAMAIKRARFMALLPYAGDTGRPRRPFEYSGPPPRDNRR